uniref:Uncharacterized protein n=1 Tax=Avena sativa TaxID=4498 RepID=A0ACD5VLP4_AVESA
MLQEFGTHLVEAAWTHQVVLLFESTPQSDHMDHISYKAFHAQMESVEGIFHWMTVLWERGFTHDNPQVRCLVMQSCLDIAWERYKGYAQMIPRSFVLGPLVRGLNDVVHHKDFGVGGVYNSETIKGAEKFFSNYARELTTCDRLHLVWNLASAAKQDTFGRAGLMTLAFCVASCACQSDTHELMCASAVNNLAKCNGDTSTTVNTEDLLEALWILSERSKHHFNPKYRLKVCEQVIKAAVSLISAAEIPLNRLLYFISTIPREFTDYTGPLRTTVQKWCVQKKECSERNTLLDELIYFPTTFMKHTGVEGSYLYDDEDVGAWEAEARRWARTLLLITPEEQYFTQIFSIWSLRCISSVVTWCNHYISDVSLHSAFSFLWEFCWEVIQHCTYATETGAELHLAAYEALVYVLSALSTPTIYQFLNFVEPKQNNGAIQLSLDLLANTFLGNINSLLTNGILTRSRRAVLMCWKWLCVDSLLSISCCCDENESQLKRFVAFDEDFESELSENHEARFEVSMLAQSPDREFTEVFINTELYARVSVAALFHQLKRSGTEEALQSGKLFLLKLLDSAVNDNDLSKELYKKYSSVHRRKVRVWQMICVLSHYVEEDIIEQVTSSVHICLYRNNLPAVRQFLETFAILIYLKFPTLAKEQLVPIFHDNEMRQQALSSYVFIAANVMLHSRELAVQRNHLNQLLPPIIPFLTSHHHSLRSFTQLLVHCVFSKLWPILQLESSEEPFIEKRCFQDLKKYLAENTDCARLRVSIEGFLDVFDPDTSGTPSGIFTARPEVAECPCQRRHRHLGLHTAASHLPKNTTISIFSSVVAYFSTRESLCCNLYHIYDMRGLIGCSSPVQLN